MPLLSAGLGQVTLAGDFSDSQLRSESYDSELHGGSDRTVNCPRAQQPASESMQVRHGPDFLTRKAQLQVHVFKARGVDTESCWEDNISASFRIGSLHRHGH